MKAQGAALVRVALVAAGLACGVQQASAQFPTQGRRAPAFAPAPLARMQTLAQGRQAQAQLLAQSRQPAIENSTSQDRKAASRLMREGAALTEIRSYQDAQKAYEKAVALREKAYGPDHIKTANSLAGLAYALAMQGEYAKAVPVAEKALAIFEKKRGPEHEDVARALNLLGFVVGYAGDYDGSVPRFERALAINEKLFGPEHPAVAETLHELGVARWHTGEHRAALRVFSRALAIREKALGPEHPAVATTLVSSAQVLMDLGETTQAKARLVRALAIHEKALGPGHADTAWNVHVLADLTRNMGDYEKARSLYERALAVEERTLGPEHPMVAICLGTLARMLSDMGDQARARPLVERALAIEEKTLGPAHPGLAETLDRYAAILRRTGEDGKAKKLLERAVAIKEKALGPLHDRLAFSLHSLADLLLAMGDRAGAAVRYERALSTYEKALGSQHPDVASVLSGLAEAVFAVDNKKALLAASRAEAISQEYVRLTLRHLSEREALRCGAVRPSGLDLALTLAARAQGEPDATVETVWDSLIRSRALILDEMAARHRFVARSPELAPLVTQYSEASKDLAGLLVRGAGNRPGHYAKLLARARSAREDAERALAAKSAAFRAAKIQNRAGYRDVLQALPKDSALVAFAVYDRFEGDDLAAGQDGAAGENRIADRRRPADDLQVAGKVPSYVAFVLPAGAKVPRVLPIGPADQVERLIERWREQAASGFSRSEESYRQAGEPLRKRIWDPIEPHVKHASRVFIVPDGALNLVTFQALPTRDDRYLVETGPVIHYLSAERDLLHRTGTPVKGAGLLALGGPAFDETGLFAALAPKPGLSPRPGAGRPGQTASTSVANQKEQADPSLAAQRPAPAASTQMAILWPFRGRHSDCPTFESMTFRHLPGTTQEVKEVGELWGEALGSHPGGTVTRLLGAKASEAAFKRLAPEHQMLHVATHGFFLNARCESAAEGTRGIAAKAPPGGMPPRRQPPRDNPLLLSGLAFAGANHRDAAGPEEEDGILTTEEIASLDLTAVQWAVLSACDTGVGEVRAGEGVFGLRRAFQVAGANTLIMSLWSVEDQSARQWMKSLYEARLQKDLDTANAVRRASLAVLAQRRKDGRSAHPFFWAAFVAAGDWR